MGSWRPPNRGGAHPRTNIDAGSRSPGNVPPGSPLLWHSPHGDLGRRVPRRCSPDPIFFHCVGFISRTSLSRLVAAGAALWLPAAWLACVVRADSSSTLVSMSSSREGVACRRLHHAAAIFGGHCPGLCTGVPRSQGGEVPLLPSPGGGERVGGGGHGGGGARRRPWTGLVLAHPDALGDPQGPPPPAPPQARAPAPAKRPVGGGRSSPPKGSSLEGRDHFLLI